MTEKKLILGFLITVGLAITTIGLVALLLALLDYRKERKMYPDE